MSDPTSKDVNMIIISDSAGDTAFNNAQAAAAQYPDAHINYRRYPFITDKDKLQDMFKEIEPLPNKILVYSLVSQKLQLPVIKFAHEQQAQYVDIFSPIVDALHLVTKLTPDETIGAQHRLTSKYFDRISAMEFAVMYDDGKDPHGFLEADVVLLGVSRTSKTPLSLFLANKNLKVANLPLVPQTHIPKEIYEIDPKKIIGLTNDPQVLNRIRRERMKAYGLNPDNSYSNLDSINQELQSAMELYRKLGCYVINVADRSIEETAALIMKHLGIES
jgi:regulator of PEP synthase PpsR (kinase-PPPase family)